MTTNSCSWKRPSLRFSYSTSRSRRARLSFLKRRSRKWATDVNEKRAFFLRCVSQCSPALKRRDSKPFFHGAKARFFHRQKSAFSAAKAIVWSIGSGCSEQGEQSARSPQLTHSSFSRDNILPMADMIECSTHGHCQTTYVCTHLPGESAGLGFNRDEPMDEDPFPDAW